MNLTGIMRLNDRKTMTEGRNQVQAIWRSQKDILRKRLVLRPFALPNPAMKYRHQFRTGKIACDLPRVSVADRSGQ